jgi:hypothetical protein
MGVAPNIEVSLIVNPDDAKYLAPRDLRFHLHEWKMALVKRLASLKFRRELRPRKVRGDLGEFERRRREAQSPAGV